MYIYKHIYIYTYILYIFICTKPFLRAPLRTPITNTFTNTVTAHCGVRNAGLYDLRCRFQEIAYYMLLLRGAQGEFAKVCS